MEASKMAHHVPTYDEMESLFVNNDLLLWYWERWISGIYSADVTIAESTSPSSIRTTKGAEAVTGKFC